MRAGTKFAIGALVIVAGVTGLIATGVKETGVYFLTPTELMARTRADSTFHDVTRVLRRFKDARLESITTLTCVSRDRRQ